MYAGPGKGAEVAAWKQGLLAETAHSIKASYACTLLDLVKAFDSVPFDWPVRQAIKFRYNLWLLRLSLKAYLLGRVLVVEGCCSRIVFATRGLTAGSVLATCELRVLLLQWADRAASIALYCRLTVYVDDVTIETVGIATIVLDKHVAVTNAFTADLQAMRLEFSPTKNVTCSSTDLLARQICDKLIGIEVKPVSRCVSLGTGLGAGTRRNCQQARKRLKAFKVRVPRFKALRRARVQTDRVLRTGGISAMTFGQRVIGVSDSALLQQRRAAVSATCDRACGADLDLALIVADGTTIGAADPAFEAHIGVVYMWSLAVWESWIPPLVLDRLVAATQRRLSTAKRIWTVVYGPAAALVASLARLEWKVVSATCFTTDEGIDLDLVRDSPGYVRGVVGKSVERWRWRRVDDRYPPLRDGSAGVGAWWKPILIVLKEPCTDTWTYQHKAALKSAIIGRQWPQQRLKQASLVEDGSCQLCIGLGSGPAMGTLLHRLECPALKDYIASITPAWLCPFLAGEASQWSSAVKFGVTRGLCSAPKLLVRSDADYDTFSWYARPAEIPSLWHATPRGELPSGARLFTDGSLMDAGFEGFQALGWAFVAIDAEGTVLAAAYGVPPRWVDSIQGAELWAVHMALQTFALPSKLYTDCQAVQKGVQLGLGWAQGAHRRYSRIWTALHFLLDEGQQAQLVLWMPAHTCKASVGGMRCSDGTPLTHTMRCANDIADVLAKEAASSIAMSPGMRAQLKERLLHACDLARFVGRVTFAAGHCKQDGFICRDSVGFDVASARRRRTPRQKRVGKVTKAVAEMTPSALEARSGVIAGVLQRIRGKMLGRAAVCEAG